MWPENKFQLNFASASAEFEKVKFGATLIITAQNSNKRCAVAVQTARSRVNLYTHCLGTIDTPGQVVYLSQSQYRLYYCHSCNMTLIDFPNVEFSLN